MGSRGMAEQRLLRDQRRAGAGVSPGLPGRIAPAKTATLEAVAEAAVSLFVLSCGPGEGGTQVTVILPCRCSAPAALHFAACCFPWHRQRAAPRLLCPHSVGLR